MLSATNQEPLINYDFNMKAKIFLMSAFAAAALAFTACDDDNEIKAPEGDKIVLDVPENIETGATYASFSTLFLIGPAAHWTQTGYCVSTSGTPTIYDIVYKASDPADMSFAGTDYRGYITATIPSLAPNTEYHVRAYVSQYQGSVIYSPEVVFTTAEGTLNEQLANYRGPQYADDYGSISGWDQRAQWNLANVHDPSVVKADDGYYYMYQTDASYGNAHAAGGHFHGRRSKDLINWEYLGGTMKSLPEWVIPKLNEIRAAQGLPAADPDVNAFGYWAPVVRKAGNVYRMYYSIVCPGNVAGDGTWGERAFIGLMETTNPADNDSWEDKGFVITNSTDKGKDEYGTANDWANALYRFNAIDPSYIITGNGEHWLIYGSWHCGIAAVKVDAATGKPALTGNVWNADDSYGKLIATRAAGNRWQASEGPEIVYRNGYYYLFLAYDALDVAYNTRVVRSQNIEGPYVGIDGTDVTAGGDAFPVVTHPYAFAGDHGWVGFAHCAVFDDGADNWYYASQARFPANWGGNEFSNALMMGHVRAIRWTKDGWPLVMPERYGAVPDVAITEDDIAGTWELIDLSYAYGQQKISAPIVLGSDHKVIEGQWKGASWSFDAANSILTIDGVELYLARECDWESAERRATIVFAGIKGTTTYWGKKS